MLNMIKTIRSDKAEYRGQMERVKSLPEDYQFVFKKIHDYIWSFAGGDGRDMLKTEYELIDLLVNAAAEGRHVLDVTGDDVAEFSDELIRGNKTWLDSRRKKLNRDVGKAD